MVSMVLSHLAAAAAALACGLLLSSGSVGSVRRRNALRWAFESAREQAQRARLREDAARAELARALARERSAREEAETIRALAATLEAEVVAARWEKEETERRALAARDEIENKAKGIAALHAALLDAVHRAVDKEERADRAAAHRPGREQVEVVQFGGAGVASEPSGGKVLPFALGR